MNLKFVILPVLAAGGIVAAVVTVIQQAAPPTVPAPSVPPASSPYRDRVSGTGIVEPSSELIEVDAPVSGMIEAVEVKEGDRLVAGQPLFVIDRRAWQAQLLTAKARLASAEARLEQARALPKPETVAQAQARVDQARAAVEDADGRLKRLIAIGEEAALSRNERPTREFELANAKAKLAEAEANLAFIKRGTYPEDLRVFEADVAAARAEVAAVETELDRAVARAPVDCTVLRVDARPGQYAAAGPGAETQVVLGTLTPLHVRAEIDELDTWRFSPQGRATAALRGARQTTFPLRFVRVVPLVQPKRTLTGENAERIDTRVMQIIYAFEDPNPPVLPGQLLDVYVESVTEEAAPDSAAK